MANYSTLIAAIQAVIKQNGNNEITGEILQQALIAMVSSLGAGYQFAGVATPETNPGTPDQRIFYLAGNGTYPNFGPTTIPLGSLGIFYYDSVWRYDIWAFPILDGSITAVKLADGAVTTNKIADGAVTTNKIGNNAINSEKIDNGAVTEAKLAYALLNKLFSTGYKFMGVAATNTYPGTPNQNVFYLAGPGTYINFNNLVVPESNLGVLKYNGSWLLETISGLGQILEMNTVAEDGLYFVDGNLNIGAKIVQDGFFAINSLTFRAL